MPFNPDKDTSNNRWFGVNEVLFGPVWTNRRVIDFMPNNQLLFFNENVFGLDETFYFVVDSSIVNVNSTRINHPETNAAYLDRWSPIYSPLGSLNPVWPYDDLPFQTDLILIDKVFLNEPAKYMMDTVNLSLFPLLKDSGMVLFNYYELTTDNLNTILSATGVPLDTNQYNDINIIFSNVKQWFTIMKNGQSLLYYTDGATVPTRQGSLATEMWTMYNSNWLMSQWRQYADMSVKKYNTTINNPYVSMGVNKIIPRLP